MLECWNAGMLAPVEYASLSFGIQRGENAGIKANNRMLEYWDAGMEEKNVPKQKELEHSGLSFYSTWDIIEAVERGLLPDKIMINVHPQRWDNRFGPWMKELVWQNVKNVVKRYLLKFRDLGIELATDPQGLTRTF